MAESIGSMFVNIIKSVLGRSLENQERCKRLVHYLESIGPELDKKQDDAEYGHLREEIRKGRELVTQCSHDPWWDILRQNLNFGSLKKLEETIKIYLETESMRGIQEMLSWMQTMNSNLNKLLDSRGRVGELLPPALPEVFGMEEPLIEVKKLLKNHRMVGVYGMGGCGKTTLVHRLCKDTAIVAELGEPIFLTVSRSPDLPSISQRLFEKLRGIKRTALIVLDDVEGLNRDVRELVDGLGAANFKILVTSRTQLSICDSSYRMESLTEEAARELFMHHASDGDQRGRSWKPDANLIYKIVKGCKLHPLALKVIGGSLKGRDAREWRNTANTLERPGGIFGDEPGGEIIRCLSTSLELLTRKERECFLDLGSFPEGQTVPATAIIDMWTETCENLKDGEIEERENGAYKILRELERRNLVKLIDRKGGGAGDPDGSFSSLYVRQHDLLRELAIHEIQRKTEDQITRLIMEKRMDKIPDTWALANGRTTQAKLVSIDTGDMEKSDWPDLNLSKAEVLILNFSATSYHLPPFLQRMKNLKVLVVANHSSNRAALDGLSLLSCLEKLKRVMLRKISLPVELPRYYRSSSQVLHKLSLVLCDSRDLMHIPSLFPSVRDLEIDYCTDMDELSNTIYDISSLEKLSITNSPDLLKLPEGIGKLSKLEVLRLQACGKLECLPQSLSELSKLRFLDISYCLNLEAFSEEMGNLGYLEKIDMRFCSRYSIELPPSMVHLESLKKVVCDEEVASLWISCGLDHRKLEVRKGEANLDFLY